MTLTQAYEALLEIARTQQQALASDDLEAFFKLEGERTRRFEAIRTLEPAARKLPTAEAAGLRAVIDQILAIDKSTQADLNARQERTRTEIAKLQPGIQALGAYIQETTRDAFFIDRSQ